MRTAIFSELVTLLGRGPVSAEPDDADLLAQFLADRDEQAFSLLVRRHGPMVFGVCRRVTGNHHLAEDAFQAVFVVLARKAGSVRPRSALAAWLYGVAYRTALRARTMSDRRRRRETLVTALPERPALNVDSVEAADLAVVVDEEIARLPDRLRDAVVLCELVGQSRKAAANQLGISEGTLSSRLATARKALVKRLREREVALSAFSLTTALGGVASARVPEALTAKALAALLGSIPANVAALSNGVLRVMFASKLKNVLVALGFLAVVGLSGGLFLASDTPERAPWVYNLGSPLVTHAAPRPAAERPHWRNKILISRSGRLALIDPYGKNTRKLGKDAAFIVSARLSPDGKKVAALIQTPQKQLVPAPPPGEQRVELRLLVRGLEKKDPWTDLGVKCRFFAWSADGKEIACSNCTDELYPQFNDGPNMKSPEATHFVVNVTTKQKTALKLSADHVITDWSRNGKFFLTTSVGGRAGEKVARMHLMNRDGTEHKALTDGKQVAMFGRLSPDGKRLLYCTPLTAPEPEKNKRYKLGLDILEIASGKVGRVEGSRDVYSYCWSPDAKRIAYAWREWHEGEFIDLLDKETQCYLEVCDQDGKNRKTIATEKGRSPATAAIGLEDWR